MQSRLLDEPLVALAALALASFSCRLPGAATPCTTDQDCPTGYTCSPTMSYCTVGSDRDAGATDRPAADDARPADGRRRDGLADAVSSDLRSDGAHPSDTAAVPSPGARPARCTTNSTPPLSSRTGS